MTWSRILAPTALVLLWAAPGRAQVVDPIRVFVFAEMESPLRADVEVPVFLPPRHPVPRDPDRYYFEVDRAPDAVAGLRRRLNREEYADSVLVVESRGQADMYLEVVATSRISFLGSWRDPGIAIIRVTIRNHDYTTDFIGERRGVLRSPAFALAGQLTRWIDGNYAMIQRLIYGLP
ncbi:MAG: hypothetical protein QF463_10815 [Vicinamibacterales bacterium]|nr:hypothetical protein [Vicinamibacterales bacterium]MDP6609545.1 hypothetical protein [Vicinamibacterales bacterium]